MPRKSKAPQKEKTPPPEEDLLSSDSEEEVSENEETTEVQPSTPAEEEAVSSDEEQELDGSEEEQVEEPEKPSPKKAPAKKRPPPKKASVKKSEPKKTPAKKAPKEPTPKKTPAKKAPTRKAPVKKSEPKKTPAKKTSKEPQEQSGKRYFKIVMDSIVADDDSSPAITSDSLSSEGGRYAGDNPMQAAKKAFTRIARAGSKGKELKVCVYIFSIQETTQGSAKKVFTYRGSREELETPQVVKKGDTTYQIKFTSVVRSYKPNGPAKKTKK